MSKPKPSPIIAKASGISDQERANSDKLQATAQNTRSQFEGPVDQSPFYKALKNTGIEATSNAYQNAQANVRSKAKAAGFGYSQPVEAGAEAGLANEEAKSLAAVPDKALLSAAPMALEAAGGTAGSAGTIGSQAQGYLTGAAVPLESQFRDQKFKYGNKLWDTLQSVGSGAVMGATGA